ncbi:3-oxoadipate enol-lactonase [Ancylobacter sp. MQZ15Z-1]|uniref:3-oxoadipate enol-lactonase n=1 Tax=Ancylobacter mangrovi TaxID=2972472 RepID=A0A9X2PKK2_9HYPH|nr:3-oxoadipate enol-lactonase [Ancylobacter mangrovi]MCS0495643.1 3-oxoadipate enol-lactonase [Ancylobacter mangrovi]
MSFCPTGWGRLHYRVDGPDGAPVLLLSNSLAADVSFWDAQVPSWARNRRVVRYDQRGHGRSDAPAGPYSMAGLGADALALMDHLGLAQADWCGISMGGMTGMWLAVNAPGRLGRLVLANTAVRMPPPELWDQRAAMAREQGMEAIATATMARWFTPAFTDREPDTIARLHQVVAATSVEGYAGCCAALRDFDFRDEVGKIRHPALVIVGERDGSTPPEAGMFIAGRIAGAQLARLDAGHVSNVEQPGEFTRQVEAFLSVPA